MLNGTNFKEWKRHVLIVLGCMDIDLALRQEQPAPLTADSTLDAKRDFERWDRSNRMSLMIMKHSIPEAFRGTESEEITQAKSFLDDLEQHFAKNDKVEMTSLLNSLMSMKYKGQGNIREYIMEMFHIASKLKALKIELSEACSFLWFWLKRDKTESAHLASASKDKGKKRIYQNEAAKGPAQKKQERVPINCYFCEKPGHLKKDCTKYHAWRAKKGLPELPKAK
ncbi:hypothetical protein HRI_004275400 [Hibiscus trionum]|uniref:CCHC-type domain-containing protein n=1 Tax=Hibiscus trionum TaxID=183268 RepID=A0A9W7J3M8_HIBTR|nr:hypothetical protein HRI_004275400 [Hibiscus trionum]